MDALEGQKEFDKIYEQSGYKKQFEKLEYCEREEDEELKALFEKEKERFNTLTESLHGDIDGEIDMDLHGNISFRQPGEKGGQFEPPSADPDSGMTTSGTYVLRDGKLVQGQGEKREAVTHSNWYCSNADPEDIRRHRELMDRMHYRGPQWEGIGIPKSIIEEENPVYKARETEDHPSINHSAEEGHKEFEEVVR